MIQPYCETHRTKKLLSQYGRKIAQKHLVMGAMGNISLRDPDRRDVAWIKRSGVWLEKAKPSDFLRINIRHPELEIARKISKEISLHLACYNVRPDVNAVIHTHPFVITALVTVLASGKKRLLWHFAPHNDKGIVIIKYYQPGSRVLAEAVKKAIKRADSAALANHGLVTVGRSLREAYECTLAIESEAKRVILKALG